MGETHHEPGFSHGSGVGHEDHIALCFCWSCWERGVLFSAGIPNLVELKLLVANFDTILESQLESKAKKKRTDPGEAEPDF